MSVFDMNSIPPKDFLAKTRTVFLYGGIDTAMAFEVGFKLKLLDYLDSKEPITLEINSPGGEIAAGLAIIDTMNFVKSPVRTVVCGMAASMAAVIAASGEKGMRLATENSKIMIHQPLASLGYSQASDVAIFSENILKTKQQLNRILAIACKKTVAEIEKDTDRDYHMTAQEAIAYGIIDNIVNNQKGDVK